MDRYTMTQEQHNFIMERVDENAHGKALVSSFLVKKYREFTGSNEPNYIVRADIIDAYGCYRFAYKIII